MRQFAHPCLGRLVQPREYSAIRATAARGIPWAADNDAFNGFDAAAAARFERMLDVIAGVPGCRFVACPDVVGEAGLTDLLFEEWMPTIRRHGLPVAYVVQENGPECASRGVPWKAIDALFIGCASDREKLGERVRRLISEARDRGLWVHMGRVNTARRIAYANELGCHSIDGTKWVRWRNTYMREGLTLVSAPRQMNLLAHSPIRMGRR